MFNLKNIQFEIDSVRNCRISGKEELETFREKYLSKSGILPEIYYSISFTRGDATQYYLKKMMELRRAVDEIIRNSIL